MKRLLTLKSTFALLAALAFVLSTSLVFAGEDRGASTEGSYSIEGSDSMGSPEMSESAQDPAVADPSRSEALIKGEEEGAGSAGTFEVESSESTGLPDVTNVEIK